MFARHPAVLGRIRKLLGRLRYERVLRRTMSPRTDTQHSTLQDGRRHTRHRTSEYVHLMCGVMSSTEARILCGVQSHIWTSVEST
jgi:hypothetical protein